MNSSSLKSMLRKATEEYEIFVNLSLRRRLGAVFALASLYLALVIITHLALHPYILDTIKSKSVIYAVYFFVLVLATLTVLPILFPRLRNKSTLALLIICSFNFFPLFLLAMLLPKFRKYQSAIIGLAVYVGITASGIAIMYDGTNAGILSQQPDNVTVVLWFTALLAIFSGIFIYGYVTEKTSVEKTQIETEIRIAQEIQKQLVPPVHICEKTYELFGDTQSASQIGGDFFEVVRPDPSRIVFAVGDVSGHNIAAGLLMAITKGAFRTALNHTSALEELVQSMNRTIFENSDKKMFVTFKCAEINFVKGNIKVVNAGHLPLLKYEAITNDVSEWNQQGLALGLSDVADYTPQELFFNRGDAFFLVTDGLVEALNSSEEEFGLKRIKQIIGKHAKQAGPLEIHTELVSALTSFAQSSTLEDDVTFLGIKTT